LREIDAEHLVYESIKPGPGGSVSLMLTPLELIGRLAALIPPPRRHRHRYYGVLAPNALLQSQLRPVWAEEQSPKRSNLGLPRRLLLAELGLMTNASLVACQAEKVSEKFQFLDFPTIPPLQRNPFLPLFPGRPRQADGMQGEQPSLTSRATRMAGDVLAKHAIH
jgi:hypothetical protein